jgi:hypothetical protein
VEMFLSSVEIESLSSCETFGALVYLFLLFSTLIFLSPSFFASFLYTRMNLGTFENLSLDGMNMAIP